MIDLTNKNIERLFFEQIKRLSENNINRGCSGAMQGGI